MLVFLIEGKEDSGVRRKWNERRGIGTQVLKGLGVTKRGLP